MRVSRLLPAILLAATALSPLSTLAAPASAPAATTSPAAPAPAAVAPAPSNAAAPTAPSLPGPDAVVAKVDGHEIHMADLEASAQSLPPELRGVPMQMLYPMLLGQVVDREALTIQAKKDGLQNDAKVKHAIDRAADEVLQNALLSREVGPMISESAIQARYDRDYKDKPGEPEVRARHILVGSEDQAKKVIAQLNKGAKFDDLAKKLSTDPGAQNGGELGWFKKGDMVQEFADAAFALKPGQITQTPVHTQFGWHVIQAEETRNAPPQTLAQMHDEIRTTLIQEGVKKAVQQAKNGLQIEEYGLDGKQLPPGGSAVPPRAPDAAPGAAPTNGTATPGAVAAPPVQH